MLAPADILEGVVRPLMEKPAPVTLILEKVMLRVPELFNLTVVEYSFPTSTLPMLAVEGVADSLPVAAKAVGRPIVDANIVMMNARVSVFLVVKRFKKFVSKSALCERWAVRLLMFMSLQFKEAIPWISTDLTVDAGGRSSSCPQGKRDPEPAEQGLPSSERVTSAYRELKIAIRWQ